MSASSNNIIGFHHVGIVVPDLDRAIEFYTGLLDYELYSRGSWDESHAQFNQIVGLENSAAKVCMLRGQNSYIELFEYVSPEGGEKGQRQAFEQGLRHLCIAVKDVSAVLARCIELGGSRINEPVAVPGGATATYCRDPFGNLIELVKPEGRFPEPITSGGADA